MLARVRVMWSLRKNDPRTGLLRNAVGHSEEGGEGKAATFTSTRALTECRLINRICVEKGETKCLGGHWLLRGGAVHGREGVVVHHG